MHTEAELEAKATRAERWRRPLAVAFVALGLFSLAIYRGRFGGEPVLMRYLLEYGWPASTRLWAYLAFVTTLLASGWLEWRITRLADAIARARTVSKISGNPNSRVAVLGETQPRSTK
ncbi:MAG: hypothetical protein HUU28_02230 [Planctomycetaceae bacterium]|nr:hypothetical protein [Planctomycetaceae bacterium]